MKLSQEIKNKIVQNLESIDIQKIILFGSYAYGEPNEDSDLDILVIEKSIESKVKERAKIRKALKSIKMPKDILVEEEAYFLSHSNKNWINTALYDAANYGEVLYEKG